MIWGQYDDFNICCAEKWDFAKSCSALPQTCVLCTFHRNHTVFAIWWWFEASATISWSGVLKSEILPNLLRMVKIGSVWLHVAYCACYYLDYRRISWPASPTPHPPLSPGFPNPETPSPARISNKFLEALSLQVMKKNTCNRIQEILFL